MSRFLKDIQKLILVLKLRNNTATHYKLFINHNNNYGSQTRTEGDFKLQSDAKTFFKSQNKCVKASGWDICSHQAEPKPHQTSPSDDCSVY